MKLIDCVFHLDILGKEVVASCVFEDKESEFNHKRFYPVSVLISLNPANNIPIRQFFRPHAIITNDKNSKEVAFVTMDDIKRVSEPVTRYAAKRFMNEVRDQNKEWLNGVLLRSVRGYPRQSGDSCKNTNNINTIRCAKETVGCEWIKEGEK